MSACGFCHKVGHNRRTCAEIKKLGAKGIVVEDDQTIEDFPDRSDDSDYEPNPEEEEDDDDEDDEQKRADFSSSDAQRRSIPAPSENPLNQPADPSRPSPSPILELSESMEKLANDHGLFDTSLDTPPPAQPQFVPRAGGMSHSRNPAWTPSSVQQTPPYVPPHMRGTPLSSPFLNNPVSAYPRIQLHQVPRPSVPMTPTAILRNPRPRIVTAIRTSATGGQPYQRVGSQPYSNPRLSTPRGPAAQRGDTNVVRRLSAQLAARARAGVTSTNNPPRVSAPRAADNPVATATPTAAKKTKAAKAPTAAKKTTAAKAKGKQKWEWYAVSKGIVPEVYENITTSQRN